MNTASKTSIPPIPPKQAQTTNWGIDHGHLSHSARFNEEKRYDKDILHSGIRMSLMLSEYATQRTNVRELSVI